MHKRNHRNVRAGRAEFERAWAVFLSKRTEADFQTWRDQEAWTAEKYRRFDRHERMPPDWKPLYLHDCRMPRRRRDEPAVQRFANAKQARS